MIVVVDYLKGNLRSVARGLEAAGAKVAISQDADVIVRADAIVLPGVGAFTDAMNTMRDLGQDQAILEAHRRGVAFLGICLGEHLMFEGGEEHAENNAPTPGLGLIRGIVSSMPRTDAANKVYKVPHVGWNTIDITRSDNSAALLEGIASGTHFYFTHSYVAPESAATIAHTTHSITFPSVVQTGNAFGVQFHPEKSSDAGAKVLANFVNFVRKG
ncbi:imidazole glycerol phosphate synthase subunit HisH [Adlercreutzia sp. ZJ304]|uniref:imidazole glycerol phosphate synthase subunit HisH n=1 Tax=Adlercreutzia sp. ZJ304 TaxID=2709791 RepID=UPI0013EB67A8|nr:imidazole glycerol phosphate synthase subunit HisH [Adlercreutzia sp. ZJ304]